MHKMMLPLKNEDGTILLVSLIIMALMMATSFSAVNTTVLELQIAGSDKAYKQNVYKAEAAAVEAAIRTEAETARNLRKRNQDWLNDDTVDMSDISNWDHDGADNDDNATVSSADANAKFTVLDIGVPSGASLDISETTVHEYKIYGLYDSNRGRALVEIGYKKRF